MNYRDMAMETEGLHTLGSFSRAMNIQKNTATTYLHELRERGFVETKRGRRGKRLYRISPVRLKKIGSRGLFEIINENSRLKLQEPLEYVVYGRDMTIEEAIVESLKTGDSRTILASLDLFRKVSDWSLLYTLAKKNGLTRHVGALYTLSRKLFRVRRIDGRILRRMRESHVRNKFIIPNLRSDDFTDIEKEWGVHIPFNKSDMERLGG
jgi:hypothetical protein